MQSSDKDEELDKPSSPSFLPLSSECNNNSENNPDSVTVSTSSFQQTFRSRLLFCPNFASSNLPPFSPDLRLYPPPGGGPPLNWLLCASHHSRRHLGAVRGPSSRSAGSRRCCRLAAERRKPRCHPPKPGRDCLTPFACCPPLRGAICRSSGEAASSLAASSPGAYWWRPEAPAELFPRKKLDFTCLELHACSRLLWQRTIGSHILPAAD